MVENNTDRLAGFISFGCLLFVISAVAFVAKLHSDIVSITRQAEEELPKFNNVHEELWKEALKLVDKYGRNIEKRDVVYRNQASQNIYPNQRHVPDHIARGGKRHITPSSLQLSKAFQRSYVPQQIYQQVARQFYQQQPYTDSSAGQCNCPGGPAGPPGPNGYNGGTLLRYEKMSQTIHQKKISKMKTL
ncbi:unnamed protein product [Strongylus vulgaris]|uniref:Nematode cuticle collagen N-terminal domain-containing protein n=1 Tax=Strongylus vulgaris TaxID=40348 RepID=A0A3P7IU09_STRVU|nr:unnamed protein product [Strongylus vulgaris]